MRLLIFNKALHTPPKFRWVPGIGFRMDGAIHEFPRTQPARFEVSEELPYLFQAVVVSVDKETGKATKIERIRQFVN